MNALAESLGHWLADYYLLSTILLAIALVAMRWMRQPARKLALTRAVIAGLFLLAVLCALPDWSPVVHLAEPVAAAPAVESVQVEPTTPSAPSVEAAAPPAPALPVMKSDGIEAMAPVAKPSPVAIEQPVNVAAWFGWVFLLGVVGLAAWLGLGMWHLGRLCRESERAPARVVSLLEHVAGAVPMLPRMLLNGRLPSAVAMGVWDTSILIPKQIAEGDEKELGSVIAHEWAHVKNGDLRLLAVSRLLLLLLWAHPLYWMLRVLMRLEQETLADAAAAEMTSRHDYAAQLVNWAKSMPDAPHRSLASAVGIWEGPSQLRRRIAMLLDEKLTVLRSCSRGWRWLAGSLCAAMAIALSLVTLRPGMAVADAVEPEGDVAGAVPSSSWTLFRGDSALTGVANEVLEAPLALAWKLEMTGPIVATAAIADGTVFIGSQDGDFRAISLETGSEKWKKQLGDTIESSAFVLDGIVYVGSGDGMLYALKGDTGEVLWKYKTDGEILGGVNFLKHEGKTMLYVGSYDNFLHCVDARTGIGLWKAETGNYVNGTPAVAEGKVMFGGCDAVLYMVDAVTGEPEGEIAISSQVANSVAVKDGVVYVAHYGNQAEAYSIKDKKQLWVFKDRNFPYFASPAVTEDSVYVADRGKRLYALDRKTGEEKWNFKARRSIDSSPVVSGALIYLGSDDGRLYAIAKETGKEVWSYEIGEAITAAPALANGHLVVGAQDSFVYAFKSSNLAATSTEASAGGRQARNSVLEAIAKESAQLRGQEISVSARQAKYGEWLRSLMAELEKARDPGVRMSLSIRALGYANSGGEYRTSETLLLELIELDPAQAARWAAELGGVYRNMSLRGLAKDHNLKRSRDAYALAIEKCDAGQPSPQSFYRFLLTLADRGRVCDELYKSTNDKHYLKEAVADYRRGGRELERMSKLADADAPVKDRQGGHGGYTQTYRTQVDGLVRLGYDADWFAGKELLACGHLKDDARADELLPKLMESPGSDVDRDYKVLLYATARYGIAKYPEFIEFWNERPAIEKTALAFFKAIQQLDHPAAAKLTAPGSPMAGTDREVFAKVSAQINEAYGKEAARLLQVGEIFVEEDWAAIRSLAPSDHPEPCLFFALKKLDGEWRIYDGEDYQFDKSLSKVLEELKKGR